jgi:hypothetical protein
MELAIAQKQEMVTFAVFGGLWNCENSHQNSNSPVACQDMNSNTYFSYSFIQDLHS